MSNIVFSATIQIMPWDSGAHRSFVITQTSVLTMVGRLLRPLELSAKLPSAVEVRYESNNPKAVSRLEESVRYHGIFDVECKIVISSRFARKILLITEAVAAKNLREETDAFATSGKDAITDILGPYEFDEVTNGFFRQVSSGDTTIEFALHPTMDSILELICAADKFIDKLAIEVPALFRRFQECIDAGDIEYLSPLTDSFGNISSEDFRLELIKIASDMIDGRDLLFSHFFYTSVDGLEDFAFVLAGAYGYELETFTLEVY